MSKITPMNGYVVLKPIEEDEQLYGNIVIPDTGKEKPEMGEVVATSSTYNYHSDKFITSSIMVGDKILIPKLGSLRITVEGDEYFICKEQDVYAKFGSPASAKELLTETVVDEVFENFNKKANEKIV